MLFEFSRHIFEKKLHKFRFHENLSSGSQVVPRGRTGMMTLRVAICNSANAPKKNSVALVRKRTIPTERPPPVGEVSANFCG